MQNCFIKLFKLQEFHVLGSRLEGKRMFISVKPKTKGVNCRDCGRYITTVKNYLPKRTVKHMYWEGNLIVLEIHRRAFFCWQCQKKDDLKHCHITTDRFRTIPAWKSYSLAYTDQILKGLSSGSFKDLSELSDSSFTLVSRILNDRIDPFIGNWDINNDPIITLGLDCHSFSGMKMLPTITDITNHKLITILPDDKRITVERFLKNIPNEKKEQISEVCIDMDRHYYQTIKKELPNVRIVVDAFHVVADINRKLSDLRTTIQQTYRVKLPRILFDKSKEHLKLNEIVALNEITRAYPDLGELWRYKEEIRRIYKLPNSKLAEMSFSSMIRRMKLSKHQPTKQLLNMLLRWQDEILAYFNNFTTNGYTEGVNTKLKTIKRLSYGFRNIDNYIRKAMLAFVPISLLVAHYLT